MPAPKPSTQPSTQPADSALVALESALRRHTQGEVRFDLPSRGRYATDASAYQVLPLGVFVPRTPADVATALSLAREQGVPVLPRGAGTSQCGQTVNEALVIDTTRHLNRVLAVDADARTAQVEPGLVLDALNARLKPLGLWYPVDVSTSAQATLGGMAGNNSCGSRSIAYGNMVHNVAGLQAWLADGELLDFGPVAGLHGRARGLAGFVEGLARRLAPEIDAHWPTVMRRVAGYNLDIFHPRSERPYGPAGAGPNLAHLLVGSEGTLAFTRSLTLNLSELPRHRVLGVVNFPSFRGAMAAAQHIVTLQPTAVELVDRIMVRLALDNPAFEPTMRSALIGEPAAILLVEFCGEDRTALLRQLDSLSTLMADHGLPGSVVKMPDEAAQKALWEVRKAGLNIMMSLKGDGKPVSFIEDCAVPLEHLADYTDALTEVFTRHGTHGTWYAHASVGTLHVRPILDLRRDGGLTKMRAIAEEAAALVRRYKGAFSGEHGDGLCRGEWIRWQFGPAIDEAFREIKRAFDPQGLFSPNRIVDPPKMDDAALLRFSPPSAPKPYRRIALKPALDWSAWNVQNDPLTEAVSAPGTGGDSTGGLAAAVEICNHNGHCRKFDAGTMCPSWRVTRDEQHLTRGRANTLRLALSGQLGPQALTGEDVARTLALCVGCKGCKRECPTGVDMARMKIEVAAQRRLHHGADARSRLLGALPQVAPWLGAMAPLANAATRLPGMARLVEAGLGFSAKRSLPRWRHDRFARRVRKSDFADAHTTLAAHAGNGRAAVLFVDTFNEHFESENAAAAVQVLRAAGYTLHLARAAEGPTCCGRTALAAGDVDSARSRLRALIAAVEPLARAGVAVVGLEPSCLLTLRDEALVLGLGEPAEVVARQALLFEEFLARESRSGRFAPKLAPLNQPLLVHAHCHRKAFGAVPPLMDVLKLIPGAQPRLIETSCCGMAGSFGFEAEHHAVSMQMAELSLLPALRAEPDAVVVADGTSCRHQIADGVQREAMHPALLLARQLVGE